MGNLEGDSGNAAVTASHRRSRIGEITKAGDTGLGERLIDAPNVPSFDIALCLGVPDQNAAVTASHRRSKTVFGIKSAELHL